MKIKFSSIIRIVISFGLLGGLFWVMRGRIGEVWQTVLKCDTRYIWFSVVFLIVMVLSLSWRLKVVFEGEDLDLTLSESVQLTCVGFFFNNFMPTAVGGDIIKAHYAGHFNKQRLKSYASVLMDRMIGLFTILMIAAAALVIDQGKLQVAVIRPLVGALLVLGAIGVIIATNKTVERFLSSFFTRIKMMRLGERLNEIYAIVHDYRNRKRVVLKSIILSFFCQSSYYMIVFYLFIALGKPVNLGNVFLIMPVVIFISMVPSLGGLGVREYAIVTFFTVLADKDVAFAVSMLALFGYFVISVAGGLVYLAWGIGSAKEIEEEG